MRIASLMVPRAELREKPVVPRQRSHPHFGDSIGKEVCSKTNFGGPYYRILSI